MCCTGLVALQRPEVCRGLQGLQNWSAGCARACIPRMPRAPNSRLVPYAAGDHTLPCALGGVQYTHVCVPAVVATLQVAPMSAYKTPGARTVVLQVRTSVCRRTAVCP